MLTRRTLLGSLIGRDSAALRAARKQIRWLEKEYSCDNDTHHGVQTAVMYMKSAISRALRRHTKRLKSKAEC